jgi:hypothetical protein
MTDCFVASLLAMTGFICLSMEMKWHPEGNCCWVRAPGNTVMNLRQDVMHSILTHRAMIAFHTAPPLRDISFIWANENSRIMINSKYAAAEAYPMLNFCKPSSNTK